MAASDIKFLSSLRYDDYCLGLWVLTDDFCFAWKGRFFRIPMGFVLDFYSMPRWLRWWRAPNRGLGNQPAGIHDATLRFREWLNLTQSECHEMFYDAMLLCHELGYRGFGRKTTNLKWLGVTLGGWIGMTSAGDGRPPRDVRRAMRRAGDDWEAYYESFKIANPKPMETAT